MLDLIEHKGTAQRIILSSLFLRYNYCLWETVRIGIRYMIERDVSSTFSDNMSLPIHRWYRYSAGFSANWVKSVISERIEETGNGSIVVLDPFAGSGTTILAAEEMGIRSWGYEPQPFVYRVASAKLKWDININELINLGNEVFTSACSDTSDIEFDYPAIVKKCYSDSNLLEIDHLRKILQSERVIKEPLYDLVWLAFVSILRVASHAGTATWQYVLPNKTKAHVGAALDLFKKKIEIMVDDIRFFQEAGAKPVGKLYSHDARKPFECDERADLVITSPPYANNYDYADATRLEMSVLGEISGWGDLQSKVRPDLIRSCSQGVARERIHTFEYLEDPLLSPIRDEIIEACRQMDQERSQHGGKKNYHTMVALYFLDMARIWTHLRNQCAEGGKVCFVIGDSAPYGVYIPVDEWLGKLAISAGFKSFSFEKTRDRNIKWKNRKHRVPLKEGRLWIEA